MSGRWVWPLSLVWSLPQPLPPRFTILVSTSLPALAWGKPPGSRSALAPSRPGAAALCVGAVGRRGSTGKLVLVRAALGGSPCPAALSLPRLAPAPSGRLRSDPLLLPQWRSGRQGPWAWGEEGGGPGLRGARGLGKVGVRASAAVS